MKNARILFEKKTVPQYNSNTSLSNSSLGRKLALILLRVIVPNVSVVDSLVQNFY